MVPLKIGIKLANQPVSQIKLIRVAIEITDFGWQIVDATAENAETWQLFVF